MIYLNHDFYKNLVAAVKSGDLVFVTSLFVNELSDLVVFDKAKLTGVLNKTNVKAKATDSIETVVDKTLAALPKNVQLQKGLAFLFAEINGLINNNKGNKQSWKQTIDDIAKGVSLVATKLAEPGSYKASVKADIMQHVASKVAISGNSNADGGEQASKPWSTGKKFLVFGSIAGFITGVIWLICKYGVSDATPQTVPVAPVAPNAVPTPPVTPVAVLPHPSAPPVVAAPIQQQPSLQPVPQQ